MQPMIGNKEDIEILVVEDSHTQAIRLQYLLENEGYRVSVTRNGQEALAYLKEHKPTIIISDIMMPEMNGFELCQHIKADDNLKHIPVIFLTSLSDPTDILKALEAKADNFITKPYDEQFLFSRIEYILVNMRLRRESISRVGLEIFFRGQKHFLNAERIQMLDLLLSSYEAAVQKYRELEKANRDLKEAHSSLSRQAQELRALSLEDELTSLHNRRGFYSLAEQQVRLADRSKKEMSLMFMDLDNMKGINDTFGHQEGDRALIDTAGILRKAFRCSDIIARMGGDEFVTLLIDTPVDRASVFSDRVQEMVDAHNAQAIRPYKISISVGIGWYDPKHPCSLESLVATADKLMYEQKLSKQTAGSFNSLPTVPR